MSADQQYSMLTAAEFGVWLASRGDPRPFNIHFAWRILGTVNPELLGASLRDVIIRHPAFSRRVHAVDGVPVWQVAPVVFDWSVRDLTGESAEGRGAQLQRMLFAEGRYRFDLTVSCPVRARLMRTESDSWVLSLLVHHIACDGWALRVLLGEVAQRYEDLLAGRNDALPPGPSPRSGLTEPRSHLGSPYWSRQLEGFSWPEIFPRYSSSFQTGGHQVVVPLTSYENKTVRQGAKLVKATPFLLGLTALYATLRRYGATADIAVASPFANRPAEHANVMACLAKMLVLRQRWDGDPRAVELVREVRRSVGEAWEHQDEPVYEAVHLFSSSSTTGSGSTAGVTASFQAHATPPCLRLLGATVEPLTDLHYGFSRFDLEFDLWSADNEGQVMLTYRSGVVNDAFAGALVKNYRTVLVAIATDPALRLSELPMLTQRQRALALCTLSATMGHTSLPGEEVTPAARRLPLVPELFAAQVARTPHAPAVRFGTNELTFAGLDRAAARLAVTLLEQGSRRGDHVGVCLERGINLVVAVLAIWRAGCVYLPLDPSHPDRRLGYMLQDSRPRLILSSGRLAERFAGASVPMLRLGGLRLDEPMPASSNADAGHGSAVSIAPRDLAYTLYTSGTTGHPKGVLMEHGSLAAFAAAYPPPWDQAPETVGLTAAVGFDVSIMQLLFLLRGSCLVIADDETYRNPQKLVPWAREQRIRRLGITPSMLTAMWSFGAAELLREGFLLELAGEAINPELWTRLRELEAHTLNYYGPTETVAVTGCSLAATATPSIGLPLAGVRSYVLGPDLQPIPPGAIGELYIGGTQVSRGYLNAPRLTAERYLPDPFSGEEGARMYRTGDLVCQRQDGSIDYLGRADDQLKVRGQRVDPYEVERVLRAQPGVRDAYVVRRDTSGLTGLVAYVVPDDGSETVSLERLRDGIRHELPEVAIPTHIRVVAELPLNTSGKIDESALPAIVEAGTASDVVDDGWDGRLAMLWAEVLGTPPASWGEHFFKAGGNSLGAARLVGRINKEFGVEVELSEFFAAATFRDLHGAVQRSPRPGTTTAHYGEPLDRVPLSAGQRRLWFLHRLNPASYEFTVPWALRVRGQLDLDALREAFLALVEWHAALRLRILGTDNHHECEEEIIGSYWKPSDLSVTVREITAVELGAALAERSRRVFDLRAEPLFDLVVLRLATDDHVLSFAAHHTVLDGRSVQLLTNEFFVRYERATAQQNKEHPGAGSVQPERTGTEKLASYVDYVAWEQRRAAEGWDEQLAFWKAELAGVPSRMDLSVARCRPPLREWRGASLTVPLRLNEWDAIRRHAREYGTTPLALGLAAFGLTLSRYAGTRDIVVGVSMDTRPPSFADVIGLFVNAVPIRLRIPQARPIVDYLDEARAALLRAHAHRHVPFDEVVRQLTVPRDPSTTPIFQVLFDFEPYIAEPAAAGLKISKMAVPVFVSKYELSVTMRELHAGAELSLTYRVDLLDEQAAEAFAQHLRAVLLALAEKPTRHLDEVSLLSVTESARLLEQGTGTPSAGEPFVPVHEQVAAWAVRTPEAPAVVCAERAIDYRTLHQWSCSLAGLLRAHGVRRGERVAICVDRSVEMVVAVLAVLQGNAAYVPLDLTSSDQRLREILSDANVHVLLTTNELAGRFADTEPAVVRLDADWDPEQSCPDASLGVVERDVAYVIYTSGSTGRPKGVLVEHGSLATSTRARLDVYRDAPRFVLVSQLAFDSSMAGLWGALTSGGCLIVATGEEIYDPDLLSALIARQRATTLLCVPSLYEVLLAHLDAAARLSGLRHVIVAGEPLTIELIRRHFATVGGVTLYNEYGPTEGTVWASYAGYIVPGPVRIGGPVPGTRLYVLDYTLQPVPVGVAGELYIGGAGVARGYFNRPQLTAEVFLPDPFTDEDGARMYRTGDRVRWAPDGALEFLGRLDNQVKIRGYRIELGEVESVLRAYPGVRDVAVLASPQPEEQLVAFVVAEPSPRLAAMRSFLAERLPSYMIPTRIHPLPTLPMTTTGKVDRPALVAQAASLPLASPVTALSDNADDLTRAVAAAWAEVLKVDNVPREVNFFDLGGHSLLMPALRAALRHRTGYRVPLLELFRFTTVAEQVAWLRDTCMPSGTGPEEPAARHATVAAEQTTPHPRIADNRRGRALAARLRRTGRGDAP